MRCLFSINEDEVQFQYMSNHSRISDYCRYFALRQRVYLVNMSEERNRDVYESLSGTVTASGQDELELLMVHGGHGVKVGQGGVVTYKLTSEALGSGIQVLADLIDVSAENVFRFRMHGTLELFQRRMDSRALLTVPIFHLCRSLPLDHFRREWQRVIDYQKQSTVLPGLTLVKTEIDLSAGGAGLLCKPEKKPTPLSMFFIGLEEHGGPICALAETVWEKQDTEGVRCGFRFIQILKADQERIDKQVTDVIRRDGGTPLGYKRNWVLMDKMVSDQSPPLGTKGN